MGAGKSRTREHDGWAVEREETGMRLSAMFRRALLACMLLSLLGGALATDAALLPPQPRPDMTIGMRYLVFETGGAKPDDALPLIVGLHYAGAEPQVMVEYFDTLDIRARVILPRAPYARGEGRAWFPMEYGVMGQAAQDAVAFDMAGKVAEFIAAARERYPTRGKPMVTGVSFGGDVTLLLGLRHPGLIAAAFPAAARWVPSWEPATNACAPHCPPIRALHGDQDTTVAIGPTREAMEMLAKRGYDARLTTYPGVAHAFDAAMERDFVAQMRRMLAVP
jgi:phospholipase/carboxylesterase